MELTNLLLLGAPRSGTTLLATMISRHSEIVVLNEDRGWAMRRVLGKLVAGNKRCIPNQIEVRKPRMLHFRFLKSMGLAMEYQSSQFCIDDYLRLPNLRVIGLIRNGPDVISSIMKRSGKPFRVAAYRWCRAVEILCELQSRIPQSLMLVSFELLVANPKEDMQRVASFLNVEYQDRMLEGPQYNPWCPEEKMNLEKVGRLQSDAYKIRERFPRAYGQYLELLSHCRAGDLSSFNREEKGKSGGASPITLCAVMAMGIQFQSLIDVVGMMVG